VAVADASALADANEELAADVRAANSRVRTLERQVESRVRRARRAGFQRGRSQGYGAGYAEAFAGFDEPFRAGAWYIVQIGRDGARLSLDSRWDVDPDSGVLYSVEGGEVYTRSAPTSEYDDYGYADGLEDLGGDLDCANVDGPIYIDPANDPHGLDGDGDGIACE
jgi:hypothetical protein